MGIQEGAINFSNTEVQSDAGSGREWRRVKFEAGKSYRLKFIDPDFQMRYRHYNPIESQKKGYYRCLAHVNPDGYCPVCAAAVNGFGGEGKYKLKKPQEVFGANVLVYNTDSQGNPIQPLSAEVYFWSFNAKKFVALRSIAEEWGDITQMDLKMTCADAQAQQYQDVSIQNLPNCLYNSDPAFKAQCDAKIERDRYDLAKMLCKEVTTQEMVSIFGLPQQYLPADMQAQMPQGQMTVNDVVNGMAPQAAPVMQPQPVPQVTPQQVAPAMASQPVSQVASQVPPQVTPQQVPPMAAPQQAAPVSEDAYADLNSLQSLLG